MDGSPALLWGVDNSITVLSACDSVCPEYKTNINKIWKLWLVFFGVFLSILLPDNPIFYFEIYSDDWIRKYLQCEQSRAIRPDPKGWVKAGPEQVKNEEGIFVYKFSATKKAML